MESLKRFVFAGFVAALVALLCACGSMGTGLKIPMDEGGKPIDLTATLHLPEGKKGPFPVVVFSHGSWTPNSRSIAFNYQPAFNFYVAEMGYAVLYVYRRGYGSSGGENNEPVCRDDTNEAGLRAAVRDVQAALEFVRKNPALDSSRVVLSGHSRGGLLSTTLAASTAHQGVRGVVSFAGGWTSCFREFNHGALKSTAGGAKVKNLWLYSQGDTFVNETHANAYADTFRQAGGDLELKIYPPNAGGHEIYSYPASWKADVRRFLEKAVK